MLVAAWDDFISHHCDRPLIFNSLESRVVKAAASLRIQGSVYLASHLHVTILNEVGSAGRQSSLISDELMLSHWSKILPLSQYSLACSPLASCLIGTPHREYRGRVPLDHEYISPGPLTFAFGFGTDNTCSLF